MRTAPADQAGGTNVVQLADDHAARFLAQRDRAIAMLGLRFRQREALAHAVPFGAWLDPLADLQGLPIRPVLVISKRRPDVADLIRVVLDEGPAIARTAWGLISGEGLAPDRVILDVTMESPVRAAFRLAFTVTRRRYLLDAMLAARSCYLTAELTTAHDRYMLVTLHGDGLARVLAQFDGEG